MKKDTPEHEYHPVDAYFRKQETNIPISFDATHWAALQTMLDEPNKPSNSSKGSHQPDSPASIPGIGGIVRLLTALIILAVVGSTAWEAVSYQQILGQPDHKIEENDATQNSSSFPEKAPTIGQPVEVIGKNVPNISDVQLPGANSNVRESSWLELSVRKMAADSTHVQDITRPIEAAKDKADSLLKTPHLQSKDTIYTKTKKKKYLIW